MVSAPTTGSKLKEYYQKSVSVAGNADTLDGYHANETQIAGYIPVLDSNARLPYSDGWTPGGTATYASVNTITVLTGAGSKYQIGMWVKFTQTTVKYFKILAISDTVLTFLVNTDHTVANAAITDFYYSAQECPVGVSDGFNYTPTITTSWTIGNGSVVAKCWMQGKRIKANILLTMGSTSSFGVGQVTFTGPVTNSSAFLSSGSLTVFDSSGTARTAGTAIISSGIIYPIITGTSYGIITNTSPYTLATGDQISVNIEYSI